MQYALESFKNIQKHSNVTPRNIAHFYYNAAEFEKVRRGIGRNFPRKTVALVVGLVHVKLINRSYIKD